jgi:hypothetical protein
VLRLWGSSRVDWKPDRLCDISTKSIVTPANRKSGAHVPIKKFLSNQEMNTVDPVNSTPSERMAKRTIREFSAPSNTNVLTRPNTTVGDGNSEHKPVLINMVQENPFSGKPNEDANAHFQHFLEVCRTFTICGVTDEAICCWGYPKNSEYYPNTSDGFQHVQ